MAPSRVARGSTQSSASSGTFFQGDGQSQNIINSHLCSSFPISTNSISATGGSNPGSVSGDVNQTVLNCVANSGPSVGASSLVTDANSSFSGGPQFQRSASFNAESYMQFPASPMSFTSNNVSGSSLIDGPSTVQQNSQSDPDCQQAIRNQQRLQQGAPSAASLPPSQTGQIQLSMGQRIANSCGQDPTNLSQPQKRPRLDMKQEDILQQQVVRQLLQRQDSMQLQNHNPQMQAFIQQQRVRQLQHQPQQQQQHMLQAMPQLQRVQMQQQIQQHLQQQSLQQMTAMKHPLDIGGLCFRKLMKYLYHQRQCPAENPILFWRKFVAEYYAPRAKKRWCLSVYENVGRHALGVFPQPAVDAWHCDLCGSKSGRGFEATYEVLPRLNEINYSSGVIDELLFVDLPHEHKLVSGLMVLECRKAVQETVYQQLRIVREGSLRIVFSQDLKIVSWEFCARRHEELLSRQMIAPQLNQFIRVAQKCQSTIADCGSNGVSSQDLQNNSNMIVTAGRQLAKSLELPLLNDLGFSKRFVRCLQIAEVVNSMKDLMDFCLGNKVGPIEALKNYPRHPSNSILQKTRIQEMEQRANYQASTDGNSINKLMAMQSGMNNPNMVAGGALTDPAAAAALAMKNYHNMMMRQNSTKSNPNSVQQEAPPSSLNNPSSSFQGATGVLPGSNQNLPGLAHSSRYLPQGPSQELQQQMIQQLLQDMASNGAGAGQQHKTLNGQNVNGTMPTGLSNGPGGSNSSPSTSGAGVVSNKGNQKQPDLAQNLHLADEMVEGLHNDFPENAFFNGDTDDCSWKV